MSDPMDLMARWRHELGALHGLVRQSLELMDMAVAQGMADIPDAEAIQRLQADWVKGQESDPLQPGMGQGFQEARHWLRTAQEANEAAIAFMARETGDSQDPLPWLETLDHARQLLSPEVRELAIEVENLAPEAETLVSSGWLHVWLNLLRNSKEAGATRITIRHEVRAHDHRFQIRDNGSGMPEAIARALLQGRSESGKPGTGRGYGLLVVEDILRRSGADFALADYHDGVTWQITLPGDDAIG